MTALGSLARYTTRSSDSSGSLSTDPASPRLRRTTWRHRDGDLIKHNVGGRTTWGHRVVSFIKHNVGGRTTWGHRVVSEIKHKGAGNVGGTETTGLFKEERYCLQVIQLFDFFKIHFFS